MDQIIQKTFKFTGGEIVNEFLLSIGYLEGAHTPDCPIYQKILGKRIRHGTNGKIQEITVPIFRFVSNPHASNNIL